MDKKNILKNGLLELFLLGELSPEQERTVHEALKKDSDLMVQFRSMEADFERMAFENALKPPATVRNSLEAALTSKEIQTPVRTLNISNAEGSRQKGRFMLAASLAALSALSTVLMYTQWQRAKENLQVLQQQTSGLEQRLTDVEKKYEDTTNKYQKINDPNVTPLLLVGNEKLPQGRATAYVNHTTKEVVVNPQGLPALDKDHTYQMWADVEGKMIDMGLVPTDRDLVALTYIDKAESLNITIEPAGGNDHPTVENLVSNIIL